MKKILASLFLLIPFLNNVFGQSPYIDSLKLVLKKELNEKDRIMTQSILAGELTFIDPIQAIKYAKEAKPYFKKNGDSEKLGKILNNLGICYAISGDYKSSEAEFLEWLSMGINEKDSSTIAKASTSLGNIYHTKGDFAKSAGYYNRALNIFIEEKNLKGMTTVYTNLGNAYKAQGNYTKALETFFKSLKLNKNKEFDEGTTLSNIGNVFADMENFSKAIEYFEKAIEVYSKKNQPYYLAWVHSNLASIYLDMNKLDTAEIIYNKAFKMHQEQNDIEGMAHIHHVLGNIRQKQKKFKEAEKEYNLSIPLYKEADLKYEVAKVLVDFGNLELERKNYSKASQYINEAYKHRDLFPFDHELASLLSAISEVRKYEGDYKSALIYLEEAKLIKDSIFKNEMTRSFAEKEAKYQNEKKQKENEILKQKNKIEVLNAQKSEEEKKSAQNQTRLLIIFSVIGVILLSLIIIVLVRSNRLKQKTNSLLVSQNIEITNQKEIIEEKNKDITDSINYALSIQQAILPDSSTIQKNLGDAFIFFKPRDIVSGDFYWTHKMENGDVLFAVADCTGHGVPGAFMSMMGNDMLNKIIIDNNLTEPGKILSELNKEVKKALAKNQSDSKRQDGMDIVLVKMSKNKNELSYASAMRPIYFIRNNILEECFGDKTPIGGNTIDGFNFTTHLRKMESEDSIYLSTDGYADQFGGDQISKGGKKLMVKRLKEMLVEISGKPMNEQTKMLENKFNAWKGSLEQIDDVCIMGIRI